MIKTNAIVFSILAIVVLLFVGSLSYQLGIAEGEAGVMCAPDEHLNDLLSCYAKQSRCEEVLSIKTGYKRTVAKSMQEWNGISVKEDSRGIFWPFTCDYFPEEYDCQ